MPQARYPTFLCGQRSHFAQGLRDRCGLPDRQDTSTTRPRHVRDMHNMHMCMHMSWTCACTCPAGAACPTGSYSRRRRALRRAGRGGPAAPPSPAARRRRRAEHRRGAIRPCLSSHVGLPSASCVRSSSSLCLHTRRGQHGTMQSRPHLSVCGDALGGGACEAAPRPPSVQTRPRAVAAVARQRVRGGAVGARTGRGCGAAARERRAAGGSRAARTPITLRSHFGPRLRGRRRSRRRAETCSRTRHVWS